MNQRNKKIIQSYKILSLVLLVGFHISSWSMKESKLDTLLPLLKEQKIFSLHDFKGVNDVRLKFIQFGKKKGVKGSLVFVTGFNENMLMYLELYHDLYSQGWSPIYSYDHRGHGLSDRLLKNRNVGYVEDWSFYAQDLQTFLEIIQSHPQLDSRNLYLIAHSMGANVATTLFQSERDQQELFNALVFSSPYFGIYSMGFSLLEPIIPTLARIGCLFYDCLKPLNFPGSYKKQRERAKNSITNSDIRFQWYHEVSREYDSYGVLPSLDWVITGLNQSKQLIKKKNAIKIQKPLLVLQSQDEKVVSNARQNQFCKRVGQNCRIQTIEGRHANFLEIDRYRDKAIQEAVEFFKIFYNK